ncbi:MAG: PaaI family thioesterase [Anaerolineae bacterium]|nr:PaaI family thioesterase [Anaerolineae bacterium]
MSSEGAGTGRQPNSAGCFVCGLQNPVGLKIAFEEDRAQGQVRAEVTVPEAYRSYPGVVHGGIVATILDETSGRALIVHTGDQDMFFATAKLEVRYRHPVPTETPLVAVGWVVRATENRAKVQGELRLRDGTVLATCDSLIVRPHTAFLAGWDQEAPYWRVYSDQELAAARGT